MQKLWEKIFNTDTAFSNWFIKYRWWIIGLMGFVLLALEIAELIVRGANPVDTTEILFYASLTGIIGLLVEMLLRSLAQQKHTMKIMAFRNQLSREVISQESWDVLTAQLARFPAGIAPLQIARLFVRNSISTRFEVAAVWSETNDIQRLGEGCVDLQPCQGCLKQRSKEEFLTQACLDDSCFSNYCFQISNGYRLIAILQFSLKPGAQLTREQKDILWNVRDEMALALQAGLDRKKLSELQLAQAALAERRVVSHYLHDNLSQNLGYLRLKLERWLHHRQPYPDDFQTDLKRMLEAAEQSYEIVRGKLEVLQPETTPLLNNLLTEHANKIAMRAKFKLSIRAQGAPTHLSPEAQQAIFYAFQEALGNIEKHAGACQVEVLMLTSAGNFTIVIQDNGRGFDPRQVQGDKHFGLQIMNERITRVNGWIDFNSSANAGTTVSISVPLPLEEARG